jgi:hypothetical protein
MKALVNRCPKCCRPSTQVHPRAHERILGPCCCYIFSLRNGRKKFDISRITALRPKNVTTLLLIRSFSNIPAGAEFQIMPSLDTARPSSSFRVSRPRRISALQSKEQATDQASTGSSALEVSPHRALKTMKNSFSYLTPC